LRQETKWIWAFFGLGVLLIVLGFIGSAGQGSLDAGDAAGRSGLDPLFQIAYPLGVILIGAGLLYWLIKRFRK